MDRNKKIIKVSIQGIIVNLILVIFKAVIGFIVNSIAIILDAVNNLSDALSSIITIVGAKLSGKAPDREHPYGHGRIEYFASIIIAVFVLVAGVTSFKESFEKILHPEVANYSIVSLVIIAVAVVVKFIFGRYVKKTGENINSKSLVASGTDAFMDSILSLSTLIAAIISLIWKISLEGYLGLIISIIIIKSSFEILKETINTIIGIRAETELTNKIKEKINSYEEVQGTYDLFLHDYGPSNLIGSAHIQVRDDMLASQIHTLTRNIATDIMKEFGIILTIGIYASNDSGKYGEIKKKLEKIIGEYPEVIQLHGFYVDESKKTISFDLIIDFKAKEPISIKNEIVKKIKEKFPEYEYYVILDTDVSD